jgi:hypothetical protein
MNAYKICNNCAGRKSIDQFRDKSSICGKCMETINPTYVFVEPEPKPPYITRAINSDSILIPYTIHRTPLTYVDESLKNYISKLGRNYTDITVTERYQISSGVIEIKIPSATLSTNELETFILGITKKKKIPIHMNMIDLIKLISRLTNINYSDIKINITKDGPIEVGVNARVDQEVINLILSEFLRDYIRITPLH